MTPQAVKRTNIVASALFIGGGLVCFAMAGFLLAVPAKPRIASYIGATPDVPGCVVALKHQNFDVKADGSHLITAKAFLQPNAYDQLQQASLAIALCHMPLKTFCMGSDCGSEGLSFVLDAK